MRTGILLVILALIGLVPMATSAAPLADDTVQPPPPGQQVRNGISAKPAFQPPAGRSLADLNGNRLSDGLEQLLQSKGRDERLDVIVTFSGPGNAATAQRAVGGFTVNRAFTLISGFAATMTAAQARALAGVPGVFRVEEDATAYINLEASRRDFGVNAVYDPSGLNVTGAGFKVCVLDTGVKPDNEQFTDGGATSRVVGFTDMVGDYDGVIRANAYDDHGHGTHVSGIIGGGGVPGTSSSADPVIAPLARGVAPGVELHVVKVLDYNGSGPDSGIIAGVEDCLSAGAQVANLSLGIPGSSDGQDALSQAINQAVDAGMVVVVAAGNSGDGEKTVGSPGAAAKAITVGAVAEHSASAVADARSAGIHPAPFSSRGPTRDGRIKPDIAAPGVSVLSAMTNVVSVDPDPFFGGGGPVDLGCGEGCYTILSGTSMSSPFVAGAVALMLEAGAAPTAISQILFATAQERGVAGKDNVFGHGLVDVEAAVRQADAVVAPASVTFPHHVFQRGSAPDSTAVRFPIAVVDMSKPLAITVTIDGRLTRWGWSPDLDMTLLDENGAAFMVPNPLFDIFGGDPMIPAPGTSSTCPAGEDCGQVGTQETIHLQPATLQSLQSGNPNFFVEIYPFAGRPNNGKGGTFTIGLSNGHFAGPVGGAHSNELIAVAGPDVTVIDEDGDGTAEVVLDGRASLGPITDYKWTNGSDEIGNGAVLTQILYAGTTTTLSLTVSKDGTTHSDDIVVTVSSASSGDTGGSGKPCNPRKKNCN